MHGEGIGEDAGPQMWRARDNAARRVCLVVRCVTRWLTVVAEVLQQLLHLHQRLHNLHVDRCAASHRSAAPALRDQQADAVSGPAGGNVLRRAP